MPRFRMTVEYDGTPYVGWQKQENGHSVQTAIENAILALTGEAVLVRGAGRTDSGVHAMGQVVHADLSKAWPPHTLRNALNAYLGKARERVSIIEAAEVDERFDARFSAHRRHYLYRIISRKAPLALEARRAWWVSKELDHSAMHAAAQTLVGYHDFTTFRSIHCQANSPLRTLDRLDVTGTLKMVGEGKWSVEDVRAALEARDRKACGPVAPPDGLYFMQVDYPDDLSAPRIRQSQQVRPA
jgi:tRNA pseudouridine38-40 synthase